MKIDVLGFTVNQQSLTILIIGVAVKGIILFGLTDGFIGVEIPTEYNVIIGK